LRRNGKSIAAPPPSASRVAPYATLATALQAAAAASLRVYACDEGTGYSEQIIVPDGARVFGGFDCIDWTYATTRRAVVHAPVSPALAIHAASSGVLMEDVEVDAPDASALEMIAALGLQSFAT
jgi:hypothetical protein